MMSRISARAVTTVLLQGQGDVLRQGHRADQPAGLVGDAPATPQGLPRFRRSAGEARGAEEYLASRRFEEPEQVLEERAFAAARAAHDDEYVAALDIETDVLLDYTAVVGHGEVGHPYRRRRLRSLPVVLSTITATAADRGY
jgi:hypothetical protein